MDDAGKEMESIFEAAFRGSCSSWEHQHLISSTPVAKAPSYSYFPCVFRYFLEDIPLTHSRGKLLQSEFRSFLDI